MSKNKPSKRTAEYFSIIQLGIEQLVADDRYVALLYAMESTGFINNRTSTTSAELGAAIIALAGVADASTLRGIVSAVVFESEFRRSNTNPHGGRKDGDWSRATAMAEFAVRSPEMVTYRQSGAKRAA